MSRMYVGMHHSCWHLCKLYHMAGMSECQISTSQISLVVHGWNAAAVLSPVIFSVMFEIASEQLMVVGRYQRST